ncbi:MAG: M48 family metalloprotease, partial [Gemmatimonadota bacterium]
ATNPVTGKREFMLMSESQEIQLGRETDPQIIASYGLYQDDALTRYIDDLGQRMAVISHRPQLQFTFRVLDSPVVNAFAVPGGYVYVTRGILSFMNNEAELAAVLAHEIGHITARHTAQQYSKAQLAGLGLGVGQILSENFRKYAGYAEFGVGLLFLRFSRDNERQADQLGVEYSSKVGYDATKMADFFTSLERLAGGAEQGGLPGWFSTHPNPADRVAATRRMAREWQGKLATGEWNVNRDQYFDTIDGLVYGEDPRQGFVEKNTFYHPSLRFQFPVPEGWNVTNLPTQVQIAPEAQDAIIMLTLEEGTNPGIAAQKFAEKTGATIHSSQEVTVNGLQAHSLLSNVQSGETNLNLLSYFIAKDNHIFILHGLSTPDRFAAHRNTFSHTMTNFSTLDEPHIVNVEPNRIQIVRVKETASFRTILNAFTQDEDRQKDLALLNGVTLDETTTTGTPFKITTSK